MALSESAMSRYFGYLLLLMLMMNVVTVSAAPFYSSEQILQPVRRLSPSMSTFCYFHPKVCKHTDALGEENKLARRRKRRGHYFNHQV
ncbi:unnamed protein product [Bursaphelenchus xylophilus]|uniref:(pine wood nematode) hypothetical protein n=1 Tax=Bursaphelenchus xylophilus TaxID=6326 RepID=A0A1I7RWE1_BURXY|nr:unnamed protein product [Bursaphelenchus xylophilus]CAG9095526.1 unnamed protein product [Bursaphelenchus xylophilus]